MFIIAPPSSASVGLDAEPVPFGLYTHQARSPAASGEADATPSDPAFMRP